MAKTVTLVPWKGIVMVVSWSDKKPRHWYHITPEGDYVVTYLGINRVHFEGYNASMKAWRLTVGPLCVTVGW